MADIKTIPINGERLRQIRKQTRYGMKRSMSQADLAQAAQVSRSYIAELERNKKKPSRRVASDLADALEIHISDLIS